MSVANVSRTTQPNGMVAFTVVWVGQLVSVLATAMSQFALTLWVYKSTDSATALGLQQVAYIAPYLIVSPLAGAMIDRYDRKLMMMLSDIGAGVATLLVFAMHALGMLQIWHLYLASFITGIFSAFQWPAYSASVSLMVPKEHLGRANGMLTLLEGGPGVLAPALAAALMAVVGLTGVLVIDAVTFGLAIAALAIVFVPQPPRSADGQQGQGNLFSEALFGFRYIFARPSLLGLQLVFLFGNLFTSTGFALYAPMVLARTGNNSFIYGIVASAAAVGRIAGGVLMSAWGGTKPRITGVFLGWLMYAMAGLVVFSLGQNVVVWAVAAFLGMASVPVCSSSNQAIWQTKVAPDVQGRVFATRGMMSWLTYPITPLIAGLLADRVFEPAMRNPDSLLAQRFGGLVGIGPGAGMALIAFVAGMFVVGVVAIGSSVQPVREAERVLPDHVVNETMATTA